MLEQDELHEHKIVLTDIGYKKNIGLKNSKLILGKVSTFKLFDFIKLNKYLKSDQYDLIILHSGHLNFLLLSFCFNKKVLKKTILSLWGGQDCRKFKVPKEKIIFLPLGYIYEFLRRSIYKNENIMIYAGLSYDDPKNISAIIKKGKEIFKDKFVPITYYMNPEEYANYISSLDMMIFNTDIQQGLGNAYLGFASGVKIVYKKGSVLYNYFKKDNYVFYDIDQILNDKKLFYKKLSTTDIKNNHFKACSMFDINKSLEDWYNVFDK